MFSTDIVIDPVEILREGIVRAIKTTMTLPSVSERQAGLLLAMKENVIKWSVMDDGGVYDIGIEWWGHGNDKTHSIVKYIKDGMLTLVDIKYCLGILATGCGVKFNDIKTRIDDEVLVTTVYSPHNTNEHNKIIAHFYLGLNY